MQSAFSLDGRLDILLRRSRSVAGGVRRAHRMGAGALVPCLVLLLASLPAVSSAERM